MDDREAGSSRPFAGLLLHLASDSCPILNALMLRATFLQHASIILSSSHLHILYLVLSVCAGAVPNSFRLELKKGFYEVCHHVWLGNIDRAGTQLGQHMPAHLQHPGLVTSVFCSILRPHLQAGSAAIVRGTSCLMSGGT